MNDLDKLMLSLILASIAEIELLFSVAVQAAILFQTSLSNEIFNLNVLYKDDDDAPEILSSLFELFCNENLNLSLEEDDALVMLSSLFDWFGDG